MLHHKKTLIVGSTLLLGLALAGCGSNSADQSHNDSTKTEKKAAASSHQTNDVYKTVYKVGQTAATDKVSIKLNSVKDSNGSDTDQPEQGKKYVIANVTLTNKSDESMDYNELDFKFDNNGNNTDPTSVTLNGVNCMGSGTLDKGASITKDVVGEVSQNTQGKFQLTYQPDDLDNNKLIHFNLQQ